MQRLSPGDSASDFSLPDHKGVWFTLSKQTPLQNHLLVFNIGFV